MPIGETMANQLLDVASNDIITSARANLINDMIDDGVLPINSSLLEIGGTATIDASRNISGNTATLVQTKVTDSGLDVSRNLDAPSTDSALALIDNKNSGDNQASLRVIQAGSGNSLLIDHAGSDKAAININNTGTALIDIQADNWNIKKTGIPHISGISIGDITFVDGSRNVTAGTLTGTGLTVGSTTIASSGAVSAFSLTAGVGFVVDSSGNLNMGTGNATIDIAGNADFKTLSVDGSLVYQSDGFFAPPVATDPGSPLSGQIWLNTTENALKIRIGGTNLVLQTA